MGACNGLPDRASLVDYGSHMLLPMQSWSLFAHAVNRHWPSVVQRNVAKRTPCGARAQASEHLAASPTCSGTWPWDSQVPASADERPCEGRTRGPATSRNETTCKKSGAPLARGKPSIGAALKPCGSFFSYLSVLVQTFPKKQTPSLGSPDAGAISNIRKLARTQHSYFTCRCCWPSANYPP